MSDRSNLIYRYDGTYQGFLCCVAECFRDKKLPQGVERLDEPQATLFGIKEIETDPELAERVERSIPKRISPEAYQMVRNAFLTCAEEKELMIIRFVLLGYKYGPNVARLAANPDVHAMNKALLYLKNEAHFHVEFLRFSDFGEFLAAVITPNNSVLPLIAPHFCDRFSGENMMIYDKTHKQAFLYQKDGRREFFHADNIELPPPDPEEEKYRALWKHFYNTIAVEGRINPRQRMTMMHKRYWKNMTEFQ